MGGLDRGRRMNEMTMLQGGENASTASVTKDTTTQTFVKDVLETWHTLYRGETPAAPAVRSARGKEEGRQQDLHFQEYWVKRRAQDPVRGWRFDGADRARPAPGVLQAIAEADAVLICPSNPIASRNR